MTSQKYTKIYNENKYHKTYDKSTPHKYLKSTNKKKAQWKYVSKLQHPKSSYCRAYFSVNSIF